MMVSDILNNQHDNDVFMQGFMLGSASNKSSGEVIGQSAVLEEISKNGRLLCQQSVGDYTFKCFFHVLDKNTNPFNYITSISNYMSEPKGQDKHYIEMNPIYNIAQYCSVIAIILFFNDKIIAGDIKTDYYINNEYTCWLVNVDDKEAGYPYYEIHKWRKVYYNYSIATLPTCTMSLPVSSYHGYPGYWDGSVRIDCKSGDRYCHWNAQYIKYEYDSYGNITASAEGNESIQTYVDVEMSFRGSSDKFIVTIPFESYQDHVYTIDKLLVESIPYGDATIVVNRLL